MTLFPKMLYTYFCELPWRSFACFCLRLSCRRAEEAASFSNNFSNQQIPVKSSFKYQVILYARAVTFPFKYQKSVPARRRVHYSRCSFSVLLRWANAIKMWTNAILKIQAQHKKIRKHCFRKLIILSNWNEVWVFQYPF